MDVILILIKEWLTKEWIWLAFFVGMLFSASLAFLFYRISYRSLLTFYQSQLTTQAQKHKISIDQMQSQQLILKRDTNQLVYKNDNLQASLNHYQTRLAAALEALRYLDGIKEEKKTLLIELEKVKNEKNALETRLAEYRVQVKTELEAANDKMALLENAKAHLSSQFETLANRVFEHKAHTFESQNKQSLENMLSPLRSQLEGFHKQVNERFGEQAKERHTLIHEIKNLQTLNQYMTQEAVNLTQALKGDNKKQGHWGEMILTRVLEESGLREGYEYQTQVKALNQDGKYFQPDVIVHLPEQRSVIIDAKMTLTAYERYFNSDVLDERATALNQHVAALRGHLKGLGRKDYHQLHGIKSLDYVLMFIPIEPAFQLAVEADAKLIRDALNQNIILVSPTTLLVALRTISNLWRYEQQNQNAKIIADKAARLYDKIRLFVEDMETIGTSLTKATDVYQAALNKLSEGRGNILHQTKSFQNLGVEIKKEINTSALKINVSDR